MRFDVERSQAASLVAFPSFVAGAQRPFASGKRSGWARR